MKTYAVLMAGGSGSRLWPLSRDKYPKQLLCFLGADSLVQGTVKRLFPLVAPEAVRVICGQEHAREISRHLEACGVHGRDKVIAEPCGRNTGPAAVLAALTILGWEPDAVLLLLPSDHVIEDLSAFHESLRAAVLLALEGWVVTFGIVPTYPETGYGYIEAGEPVHRGARTISRFVEKPDAAHAATFLASGNFFWNSGMFAVRASTLLDECRRHAPALIFGIEAIVQPENPALGGYEGLPSISIDHAVMEKTKKGVVLPARFGWSDIGTWKSLYEFLPKDENENLVEGDVIARETRGCLLVSRGRLLAANGLRHTAVVETPDAVLVSALESSRDVKAIVETLRSAQRRESASHVTVHGPWGYYRILEESPHRQVRRIVVEPGRRFPLDHGQALTAVYMVLAGRGRLSSVDKECALETHQVVVLGKESAGFLESDGDHILEVIAVSHCHLPGESAPSRRPEPDEPPPAASPATFS